MKREDSLKLSSQLCFPLYAASRELTKAYAPLLKEMGLNPKSLIRNIPNKKEMWKAPVKDWIHDMYEKRQRKSEQKAKRKKENKQ